MNYIIMSDLEATRMNNGQKEVIIATLSERKAEVVGLSR